MCCGVKAILKGLMFNQYQFAMRARDPVRMPSFKGGVLRGAFGLIFKRIACLIRDGDCRRCETRPTCPYYYIFEPGPLPDSQRLRNLESLPRPFVIRSPGDRRNEIPPGDALTFEVVLVGTAVRYLPYFILVFRELGIVGLGSVYQGRRGRAHLEEVRTADPLTGREELVFDGKTGTAYNRDLPITGEALQEQVLAQFRSSAGPAPRNASRVTLRFLTVTRLKFEGQMAAVPEFHVLVRSLLRRYSTLAYFYHGIIPDIDFRGLIEAAGQVRAVRQRIMPASWERYSSRQRRHINMDGFVGSITYEGDLEPYLPLLAMGEVVHVGKGATFGLGRYRMESIEGGACR